MCAINSTISSTAQNSYRNGKTLGGGSSGRARFDVLGGDSGTAVSWFVVGDGELRRLIGDTPLEDWSGGTIWFWGGCDIAADESTMGDGRGD